MNTHPHPDNVYQARLAGTLRSLSFETVPHDLNRPKRSLWWLVLCGMVASAVTGLILAGTDIIGRINASVAAVPDSVTVSRSASGMETLPASQPVTAVREITGSGFVVAPRMTTVFSKYEGRITHVAVQAGDRVVAGQILLALDDASARFALQQAEAAEVSAQLVLDEKNIDLAQARASLKRIEALSVSDAVSRQVLEDARTTWERRVNTVAQAQQNLVAAALAVRIAQEPVTELTVRAPVAGTVTRLGAHVGDSVLAHTDSVRENQSLLTITDTTGLVIDADVTETNLALLQPGLRGEAVLDGFPEMPFPVEVLRIAPVVSAEKGIIAIRLSLTGPPEGIRPNMAARIRILPEKAGDMTQ